MYFIVNRKRKRALYIYNMHGMHINTRLIPTTRIPHTRTHKKDIPNIFTSDLQSIALGLAPRAHNVGLAHISYIIYICGHKRRRRRL